MNAHEAKQQTKDVRGIRCPKCGCGHWRVIYTRPAWQGALRRRRECRNCGKRITTRESQPSQLVGRQRWLQEDR